MTPQDFNDHRHLRVVRLGGTVVGVWEGIQCKSPPPETPIAAYFFPCEYLVISFTEIPRL